MREVDFFRLPRHVQERFVTSTNGVGVPSVLLSTKPGRAFPKRWIAVTVAGLGLVLAAAVIGYGALGHSQAITGAAHILVYAGGLAAAAFGLLRGAIWISEPERLPYPVALYLYPVGVVDATTAFPRIYPLTDLKELETSRPPRTLTLRFAGGITFRFDAQTATRAEEVERHVQRYRAELPMVQHDPRELAALDPLTDSGVPNPLLPTIPLVRSSPWWARFPLPVAIGLGAGLGVGLWYSRNSLSEKSMLRAAVAANTVESYLAYLAAGGTHPQVSDLWLPRAELQRARQQGTVAAIEQFAEGHPNSKLAGEVTLALREALLAKLERAKKTGHITALRQIAKQHRQHDLIAPELRRAIRDTYLQAYERFRAHSPDGASAVHAWMKRLVAYVEQHGPTVQIRFQGKTDRSVELLDRRIRRGPYGNNQLPPAQYFNEARTAARQGRVASRLVSRLQREFAPEILRWEYAPNVPSDSQRDIIKVPTLTITHTLSFTGATTLKKYRAVFVPIAFAFRVMYEIPGDSKPLAMKFRTTSRPDLRAVVDEATSPEKLYQRMADKCDDKFTSQFLRKLLKQP
ncbi:hypothetical protein ACFL5O_04310 [Myxococcota bacterium]